MSENPWKGFIKKEPLSERILSFLGAMFLGMVVMLAISTLYFPGAIDGLLSNYAYYAPRMFGYERIDAEDARDFTSALFQAKYFEANANLGHTDYADDGERLIAEVNSSCGFVRANHTPRDVLCISENIVLDFKLNESNVYDYNHDGERICQDYAITYVYLMRKFGIQTRFLQTGEHVLAIVSISPGIWVLSDPVFGGFDSTYTKNFIYAELG